MIVKIFKNNTDDNITLINMNIPARSNIFIEATMWAKLLQELSIFNLITSGAITVNNGSKDLSITEALHHVLLFQEEEIPGKKHFSYRRVYAGDLVTVPYEQQMLSYQEIEIENTGELEIEGEVIITV